MNNVPTQCQQDRINMIETRRNIHMANYIVQRERERERERKREREGEIQCFLSLHLYKKRQTNFNNNHFQKNQKKKYIIKINHEKSK